MSTIQPQPSKVIFEIVFVKGFLRIQKSEYYSGDKGNPPLVKLLNIRGKHLDLIRNATARCAKDKLDEGYFIRFDGEKNEWICELELRSVK
jgi:hypothetical protein